MDKRDWLKLKQNMLFFNLESWGCMDGAPATCLHTHFHGYYTITSGLESPNHFHMSIFTSPKMQTRSFYYHLHYFKQFLFEILWDFRTILFANQVTKFQIPAARVDFEQSYAYQQLYSLSHDCSFLYQYFHENMLGGGWIIWVGWQEGWSHKTLLFKQ